MHHDAAVARAARRPNSSSVHARPLLSGQSTQAPRARQHSLSVPLWRSSSDRPADPAKPLFLLPTAEDGDGRVVWTSDSFWIVLLLRSALEPVSGRRRLGARSTFTWSAPQVGWSGSAAASRRRRTCCYLGSFGRVGRRDEQVIAMVESYFWNWLVY